MFHLQVETVQDLQKACETLDNFISMDIPGAKIEDATDKEIEDIRAVRRFVTEYRHEIQVLTNPDLGTVLVRPNLYYRTFEPLA